MVAPQKHGEAWRLPVRLEGRGEASEVGAGPLCARGQREIPGSRGTGAGWRCVCGAGGASGACALPPPCVGLWEAWLCPGAAPRASFGAAQAVGGMCVAFQECTKEPDA